MATRSASLGGPAVGEGLSAMFATFGGLIERIEMRDVGGEMYGRAAPVGGRDGPPPPWWALGLLARLAPPLRRRSRAARRMARDDVLDGLIERWHTSWRPELRETAERLRAVDLAALDDRALDDHLGAAIEPLRGGLRVHFQLMRPGEVLVCPTTDPAWSVLFGTAGRIVAHHAAPPQQGSIP